MSTREHLHHVSTWLTDFAGLTAGKHSVAEAQEKIAHMASVIADEFPDAAMFTRASLVGIAQHFDYTPSYAALKKALRRWDHARNPKPATLALPGIIPESELPELDERNRFMVAKWNSVRAGTAKLPKDVSLTAWLDMCRTTCTPAFRHIVRLDEEAAGIARQHGWRTGEDETATALERVGAQGAVSSVRDALLAALPQAPDPAHALDTSAVARAIAQIEARKGRKIGALDPAVLEKMRADNGLLNAALQVAAAAKAEAGGMAEAVAQRAAEEKAARATVIDLFPVQNGEEA